MDKLVIFYIFSTELWVRCEWGPSSGRKGLASSIPELAGEQGYGCTPNVWAPQIPDSAVYAGGHSQTRAHCLAPS